ncbi:ECF transporter S component [Lysinibacillus capsici]|uniref:ECF transporter S component n=1 Tax=Lysinibacillus capsici TaxID=2115968 RepID=UPI002646824C|nr:ECF transporter S component [Lysinibacillus capsici]
MKKLNIKSMVAIGMLSSISYVLMLLNFPIPPFPQFLMIDFSDIPALIAALIFGPAAGILVELIKNILDYFMTGSATGVPVGHIANFAAGNVLNQLLKKWEQRPRPEIEDQLTSFSFPSGHSMTGILYLFTLAYILAENSSKGRKILLWLGATILMVLIGLSRIAGARHFATDVLAGWSIGYTWFIICVIWYERRKRLFQSNHK